MVATTANDDKEPVKTDGEGSAASFGNPASWPLHPILLPAASVLALYVTNLRETSFVDVVPTLAIMIGAGILLLAIFALTLRRLGPRAAILASIALVGALYYRDIVGYLRPLAGNAVPVAALVVGVIVLAVALIVLVARTRFDLVLPNAILNGIALVLFLTPAWKAASYTWETGALASPASKPSAAASLGGAFAAPAVATTPDIYYLIFDRYGSEHTLAREYGFDNSPFLDGLRDRGFYVASDSHSNYPKTAPSLASTFHMGYLDFLADRPLAKRNEWHPVYDMLESHDVGDFLKSRGYRFIQIGAWWAPTQSSRAADENYSFGFSEFASIYSRRTIFPPLLASFAPTTDTGRRLAWDNGQCRRVPLQFQKVKEIAERPEATFTFVHLLLPHEPYVFDADGDCLDLKEVIRRGEKPGYIGQLHYANTLIEDAVETLLEGPDDPIIILQADEGPYPERYRFGDRSWSAATPGELAVKSGILNAYYFPDGDYSALDPDITPVNTFRVLFDKYFGTNYGRLPDRLYAFPDYSHIYDFFDVTDISRRGDKPVE